MSNHSYRNCRKWAACLCAALLLLSGCSDTAEVNTAEAEEAPDAVTDDSDAGAESAAEDADESNAAEDSDKADAEEETSEASGSDSGLITPISLIDVEDQFTERDLDPSWEDRDPVYITLNGSSALTDSESGAAVTEAENGEVCVSITEEGVYVFSGTLNDGQIYVNCADDDAKVQLVLNGADITNDDGACILVLSADKCFLTLAEGSDNTLSDTGAEYVQPEETDKNVDGVIFADCDLSIGGSGTLTVNAGYDNGIVSKDDLKITGGMLIITSAGKGIEANDSIRAAGGVVIIDAQDDALNTDNDEDSGKGYIYIEDGTFTLSSGDDGIHAATALLITGGSITITESYEGLEGDSIDINGGDISVTASDDGLNASTSGGTGAMNSGMGRSGSGGSGESPSAGKDDSGGSEPSGESGAPGSGSAPGEKEDADTGEEGQSDPPDRESPGEDAGTPDEADNSGMPSGGNAPAGGPDDEGAPSGEPSDAGAVGLSAILSSSGTEAQDDAASDTEDGSSSGRGSGGGAGMNGGMGAMSSGSTDAYIRITGGTVYVNAEGDGIDSNGSLYIEGGTIYVDGPVSSGDGAIDYGDGDVEAVISGGTFIAVGSTGMAENFTSATQYEAMVSFSSKIAAGTQLTVTDSDGSIVLSYTPSKTYQSVVFSSPDLTEGEYTLTAGDESITVTISDYINSSGNTGFGSGSAGGMGGGGMNRGMGGGRG